LTVLTRARSAAAISTRPARQRRPERLVADPIGARHHAHRLVAGEAGSRLGDLLAIHLRGPAKVEDMSACGHGAGREPGRGRRLDRIKPETFMPAMIQSFDNELAALREELAALRR